MPDSVTNINSEEKKFQRLNLPEVEDPEKTQKTPTIRKKKQKNSSPSDLQSDSINQVQDSIDNQPQKKTVVEFNDEDVPLKDKKEPDLPKPKKKHLFWKIVLGLFVFAFLVLCIFGIWNRWFRYDDQELMMSKWQINGSTQVVTIDKKNIDLGPNACMEYTLDTGAKVINYKIGDKTGQSHYRFSWDKNQLAIIENTNCDPISTLFSDIGWFWDWSTCGMSKIDLSPAYTKNNKEEVDLENTGINDIMKNGQTQSILLDRITTKTSDDK